MNKKFLSAILFGALMVTSTGTFVSCKDYDDDIENLQSQINNLATKSDVEAKLAQLQAALNAAQAESSANAADIAALEKEVASMMAKVEAAVESEIAEYKTEIEALVKKVETLVGKVADFVTSVELVDSYTAANGNYENAERANLSFASAIVTADHVFGEDLTGELTFTKGDQVQTTDQFVVRVSPTNAVLTPEMISLVDSEGKNLDEMLTIVSVEKFNGVLGVVPPAGETRAATNTGLWTVTAQLTKYNEKAFNAASLVKADDASKGLRLYAVQVNNAIGSADARYVSSSYDLTLNKGEFEIDSDLDFIVKTPLATKHVTEINNRVYNHGGKSFAYKSKDWENLTYKELAWATVAKDALKDNTKEVHATKPIDGRYLEDLILGVQGEEITISIVKEAEAASEYNAPSIAAMYVVLDKANAVESLGSEINAWNAYTYTGLEEVVKGTTATIKVDYSASVNDIIGFRVFAVNHDGKLVDPDGRAFYVQIGNPATEWNVANTTIYPTKDIDVNNSITHVASDKVDVELSKLTGAKTAVWAMDAEQVPFSVVLCNSKGEVMTGGVYAIGTNKSVELDVTGFKFEDVAKVYTVPAPNKKWTDYVDDKTYTGTLTVYDETGFELGKLAVTMTKKLPTELPEGFAFKDKQVINGIYNCYMIASPWAAPTATKGTMPVENFIYFGEGEADQYKVTIAEAAVDADGKQISEVVLGSEQIEVAPAYVDNATEHATVVEYNYGEVSSVKDAEGKYVPVIVKAAEIKTVFCCFYKPEVHTWGWATREQLAAAYPTANPSWTAKEGEEYVREIPAMELTYGTPFTLPNNGTIDMYIFGKNSINNIFSTPLASTYESSLLVVDAKLISDATQHEDYFKVNFDGKVNTLTFEVIKKDEGSNPKENVPSTLIIKCKDSYNHDVTISLPMIVKPF